MNNFHIYLPPKKGNNNDYDIPGISTFSITVRSTVGEGCNLALSHDLAMKKSYEKAKAAPGMTGEFGSETGKPGENGIDGTDGLQGTKGQ